MDCPVSTGFDTSLMICNYINKLARCQEDVVAKISRSDPDNGGLISRQTQQRLQLEVAELGYYSSDIYNHTRSIACWRCLGDVTLLLAALSVIQLLQIKYL